MMRMELRTAPTYSVKTRVLMELERFPATVKDLVNAGCGSDGQVRYALRQLARAGDGLEITMRGRAREKWYGLKRGAGYKVLR